MNILPADLLWIVFLCYIILSGLMLFMNNNDPPEFITVRDQKFKLAGTKATVSAPGTYTAHVHNDIEYLYILT